MKKGGVGISKKKKAEELAKLADIFGDLVWARNIAIDSGVDTNETDRSLKKALQRLSETFEEEIKLN